MTLPTRWNPFDRINRMDPFSDFDELLRAFGGRSLAREYEKTMDMRLDVNEDEKRYVVNVDMPGVKKEHIDVSIEGNQIAIRAEVKREKSSDQGKEIYNERYSGQAYRAFTLPTEIDSAAAQATYDGGVLTLTLPKKAGSSSTHLPVN